MDQPSSPLMKSIHPPGVQYVVVTGGVLSSVGKGIAASSLGVLLKASGLRVTSIKVDPYLNIDAGTMSPFEHGEVFVLDDGGEVDLDLGNYERFLGLTLRRENNITTGKIYNSVIQKERQGNHYLGKTVQVVPHICNEIQDWIERVASVPVDGLPGRPDVCVIELGGTVGDIESMPFVEALRQFQFRVGSENICFVHLSLLPEMGGEQKTKPTQHSVRELRALGLFPDLIFCRSTEKLAEATKSKLASFCHVPVTSVIGVHNVSHLYSVPLLLKAQGVDRIVLEKLGRRYEANVATSGMRYWIEMEERARSVSRRDTSFLQTQYVGPATVRIALVGKYTKHHDAYHSVTKALEHSALAVQRCLEILWIEASDLEESAAAEDRDNAWAHLRSSDGILVPGGFGERGVEGMILAARYAREQDVPFLGVCLGLQVAVIEFARNVLGKKGAHSAEFDVHSPHPVVIFMPEGDRHVKGGTMRLGARSTFMLPEHRTHSALWRLYGKKEYVLERHRHRYEVEPAIVSELEEKRFVFVGRAKVDSHGGGLTSSTTNSLGSGGGGPDSDDTKNVRNEMAELLGKRYYVGVQFHPEFKSGPFSPSPPFLGLVAAASRQLDKVFQTLEKRNE